SGKALTLNPPHCWSSSHLRRILLPERSNLFKSHWSNQWLTNFSYEGRFAQFFDAIKAKYPQLKVIATTKVTSRETDVLDEHYYRRSEDEMASHAHDYDSRPRTGPKIFVGEWATRVGDPTPNMSAALGDASWMTGMEQY